MGGEDGTFIAQELPVAAQLSPMYAALMANMQGFDRPALIVGGNLYGGKTRSGSV